LKIHVHKPTSPDGSWRPSYLRFVNPLLDAIEHLPLRGQCDPARPSWEWNSDVDKPTLTPSVLRAAGDRWHYFVVDGRMHVLADSPTGPPDFYVDLPDVDEWLADGFKIWCVYQNPRDYPGKFVVRRWTNNMAGAWCHVADSLESVRRVLPRHLNRMDRDGGDDPCIVEVWL
jgi:hypothetical protein